MTHPAPPPEVAAVLAAFPPGPRVGLWRLRDLILDVAAETNAAGTVTEALRWGQPAYLCRQGTTLRLGVPKSGGFALYVHCRTSLIAEFTSAFPGMDRTEGSRALLFERPDQVDAGRHGWLIARALTYHRRATPVSAAAGQPCV